jgi:hypothetical protein
MRVHSLFGAKRHLPMNLGDVTSAKSEAVHELFLEISAAHAGGSPVDTITTHLTKEMSTGAARSAGNSSKPMMLLAQLGCRKAARLRPQRVQRAERRSRSGDTQDPTGITSGAIAMADEWPQRSPSQQTQSQREFCCNSAIERIGSMVPKGSRFRRVGKPLHLAVAGRRATIPFMNTWQEDLILAVPARSAW